MDKPKFLGLLKGLKVNKPIVNLAIAVRNDYLGLWFTVHSAIMSIITTPLEGRFTVTVCNNSDDPIKRKLIRQFCQKIPYLITYDEIDRCSNHLGRKRAVEMAQTPYCILADSHVLFGPEFFSETVRVLQHNPHVGMVHTPFSYAGLSEVSRIICFYNLVKWDVNMHGSFSRYGACWDRPYPAVIAPHSGCAFRTDQWLDYGGYMDICDGHGGGEPFVTYKYWMFGSQVWITPLSIYIHWRHPDYRKSRREWYKNFTRTAFALGGFDIGTKYSLRLRCGKAGPGLWKEAQPYHEFVKSRAKYTFEELMDRMKKCKARPLDKNPPPELNMGKLIT